MWHISVIKFTVKNKFKTFVKYVRVTTETLQNVQSPDDQTSQKFVTFSRTATIRNNSPVAFGRQTTILYK